MNPLKQKLDINNERYRIIVSIKEDYLDGKLSLEAVSYTHLTLPTT